MKRRPAFALTVIAVLFLFLDGVLLVWVGLYLESLSMLMLGLAFLGLTVLVVVHYRRHLRDLADLEVARTQLKVEMESMMALAGKTPTRDSQASRSVES